MKMDEKANVAGDLQSAEYAYQQMSLKVQEFTLHARFGRWAEAERAREQALGLMESHMDAFMRACKATDGIK